MLSIAEIEKFISEDETSEKKMQAAVGERYYEAEHDIKDCRFFYYNADGVLVEDKVRSNIKISHPFFTILADQLSAYMLSFEKNPIRAKEGVKGLQTHLDTYFDGEFWAEIGELITGAYSKGFEYIYGKRNDEDRLCFECADSMGVVEVQAKYASDGKPHKIWHYVDIDLTEKGKRTVTKIQVWDEDGIHFYMKDSDTASIVRDESVEFNPRPHVVYVDEETGKKTGKLFKFIPFWRLDNNRKQTSGLKPIKALIDDYDRHACALTNNLTDFDTPLHVVRGFEGDDLEKLQQNLKTKKMIGVEEGGGVDVQTVDIPYQARREKLEIDKEGIFTFGMGLNPSQVGDGNVTNVVIRSRYALLDLKANKLEDRLCSLLKKIIKIVLEEINEKYETDYQITDTYFEFTRAITTNESENIANEMVKANTRQIEITTILNVAASIGDKKAIQLICEALDIDYEEIEKEFEKAKEQSLETAKEELERVLTDE